MIHIRLFMVDSPCAVNSSVSPVSALGFRLRRLANDPHLRCGLYLAGDDAVRRAPGVAVGSGPRQEVRCRALRAVRTDARGVDDPGVAVARPKAFPKAALGVKDPP